MIRATIGYLLEGENVLLIYKKRGFGRGLYNGFGGKLKEGESYEECLEREAQEELSITIKEMKYMADLMFYDSGVPSFFVRVFTIRSWDGIPSESDEVKPIWFKKAKLPLNQMWEDDRYWLHNVLSGKRLKADFYFSGLFGKNPKMLGHRISLLE